MSVGRRKMVDMRIRGALAALVVAVLGVLGWWSIAAVQPPSSVAADADPGQFSADRAFAHVEQVASEVHVAGSPAAADVRDYIVATLTGLGVQTREQRAVGATNLLGENSMASVTNVIGLIPGSASTGRIFLVAHYDSVQVSYGANDDGAGVATLLEAARAIVAGPQLRNDVVLVFTDAEEACLCGAEAFVGQDALAKDGGVVLNVESRGSRGPAVMFETNRGNADLVDLYADAAPNPVATSFAVEVYRILPNDTDFTPFREDGAFTGLNTAYIDGEPTYHTPQDRPEYLSRDSLQHLGGNTLGLLRALGGADIAALKTPSAGDATYFPVLGTLVQYPGWLVWPLAGLALLASLLVGLLAIRRRITTGGRLLAGFGLVLVPLALGPASAQGLWWLLTVLRPQYQTMSDPWQPNWYRGAVVALVALVVLAWFLLLRRRIGGWALGIGALIWLGLIAIGLAWFAPGGSYLAAVPCLFGALGAAMAVLSARLAAVGALVGAIPTVLVLAPTVYLFFPAMGLELGGVGALFATMLTLALLIPLDAALDDPWDPGARRVGWLAALGTAVVAVALSTVGLVVDEFDAQHPDRVQLMYALDADSGQAWWVRRGPDPSGWSAQYVNGAEPLAQLFPVLPSTGTLATGPAEPADLPPPTVVLASDQTNGSVRSLTLQIVSHRDARAIYVEIAAGTVVSATAEGRTVTLPAADEPFELMYHAPPDGELVLTLQVAPGPLTLQVLDVTDGLLDLPGFRPRPTGVGVAGSHTSEAVVVSKHYTI